MQGDAEAGKEHGVDGQTCAPQAAGTVSVKLPVRPKIPTDPNVLQIVVPKCQGKDGAVERLCIDGWTQWTRQSDGRKYYYHEGTKVSQWEPPPVWRRLTVPVATVRPHNKIPAAATAKAGRDGHSHLDLSENGKDCGGGWRQWLTDKGCKYYHHARANLTQWDAPASLRPAPGKVQAGRKESPVGGVTAAPKSARACIVASPASSNAAEAAAGLNTSLFLYCPPLVTPLSLAAAAHRETEAAHVKDVPAEQKRKAGLGAAALARAAPRAPAGSK